MIPAAPPPPAVAAPAPRPADWPVEELVVSASPGPVFWRVTRGDGEVWILGVPEVFERGRRWNTRRLRLLLSGARELLTSAQYELQGGVSRRRETPRPLATRLPPELAAEVAAAARSAGEASERYAGLSAVDAAYRLRTDLLRAAGLTTDQPDRDVRGLAGRRFLTVRAVARYDTPFAEQAAAEAQGSRCVAGALADAAFAREHAVAASRAWAVGDLRTVRDNTVEPQTASCLDQAPSFAALSERVQADTAAALGAALDRGGRTVAMLTLGTLLKRGGALDRLRAAGAQVTTPRAARDLSR